MKYSLIFISFVLASAFHVVSAKSQKEVRIESASQFQNWCKHLSYHYFRQKQQQPYNWVASTIRQLNDYQTSGSWKINNAERTIFCHIRIGKKAKQTKMQIR
ncbi:MAG: hypothetical protein OQK75_08935 [Gammaproteobacteria bacterium]|nr:hypothetical protein [Gammaproteobacteria bacterium]MCW8987775.1 hypothetical protein [Gammaproteobacteria bacterium]MCW9029887.1 hypothetical protein [Gammaproteobacteria bacterium]